MTAPNISMEISFIPLSGIGTVNGVGNLDGLLGNSKWGGVVGTGTEVSYSFPWDNNQDSVFYGYLGSNDYSTLNEPFESIVAPLSFAEQESAISALESWSNVCNLNFVKVDDTFEEVGDIRFAKSSALTKIDISGSPIWGRSYFPTMFPKGGDIWINTENTQIGWENGSYNHFILMHEIGHSLGLKHPFDFFLVKVLPSLDCQSNTVMSYNAAPLEIGSRFSFNPTTPMVFDIDAIQYIYGANTTYNASDTTYSFRDELYHETIYDAGGIDTIKYIGVSDCFIDLGQGRSSNIGENVYINFKDGRAEETNNIWIANNVIIENSMGGDGNDILVGNSQNNNLSGGEGIDTTIYNGDYVNFSVTKTENGFDIQGEGLDHITGIERIKFNNVSLALDLEGNAGLVAKIIGAVFGRSEIDNWELVGIGLNLIDGGMSISDITQLALESKLGENYSIQNEICLLYFNIFDKMPTCSEFNYWEDRVDSGELDNISLAGVAITSELNKSNIGYDYLVSNGIEFV